MTSDLIKRLPCEGRELEDHHVTTKVSVGDGEPQATDATDAQKTARSWEEPRRGSPTGIKENRDLLTPHFRAARF